MIIKLQPFFWTWRDGSAVSSNFTNNIIIFAHSRRHFPQDTRPHYPVWSNPTIQTGFQKRNSQRLTQTHRLLRHLCHQYVTSVDKQYVDQCHRFIQASKWNLRNPPCQGSMGAGKVIKSLQHLLADMFRLAFLTTVINMPLIMIIKAD